MTTHFSPINANDLLLVFFLMDLLAETAAAAVLRRKFCRLRHVN